MSALAHYLESEGVATTGLSLIREHSAHMRPPRALWVPFPLGRPLGAPGDPGFQRRVLLAALELLGRPSGPVLEDFPQDAPASAPRHEQPWSCPVSFPPPPAADLGGAVRREMDRLAPWYDLSVRRRGRTTLGISGLDLDAALGLVLTCCEGRETIDTPDARTLRAAIEDLKVYYQESATARPGERTDADGVARWLWNDTALGRMLRRLARDGHKSRNAHVRFVTEHTLVPRAMARGRC